MEAGDAARGVAVTVGISYTEYYLNSSAQPMTAYTATSGTLSVVCGRLSFTLGLKARPTPCMAAPTDMHPSHCASCDTWHPATARSLNSTAGLAAGSGIHASFGPSAEATLTPGRAPLLRPTMRMPHHTIVRCALFVCRAPA